MTTIEAIRKRRSIRKYKNDQIPEEIILELLDAARLAPSGCNAQPWRFRVIKDIDTKLQLVQAAYNQKFISEAPVVLVVCANIKQYLDKSVSGIHDLGKIGAVKNEIVEIIEDRVEKLRYLKVREIGPLIAANVAIAIEHIVLRALDFDLGTCWVRLFDWQKVKEMFDWDDDIYVVALLPIGYPNESPEQRKRLSLQEIMI
ncbi:unnamed protein product [marine sediment metagenome]|uniref:Nitroreductase domain-containing protein n=1 Tax=marine sediment metagenome TaxID=412755 RepID=X1U489_9ZZZZ